MENGEKVNGLQTLDDQLKLIYEWAKIDHINLAQFKRLTKNAVEFDYEKRNGLRWTED